MPRTLAFQAGIGELRTKSIISGFASTACSTSGILLADARSVDRIANWIHAANCITRTNTAPWNFKSRISYLMEAGGAVVSYRKSVFARSHLDRYSAWRVISRPWRCWSLELWGSPSGALRVDFWWRHTNELFYMKKDNALMASIAFRSSVHRHQEYQYLTKTDETQDGYNFAICWEKLET